VDLEETGLWRSTGAAPARWKGAAARSPALGFQTAPFRKNQVA
jgi:hypothetical protein